MIHLVIVVSCLLVIAMVSMNVYSVLNKMIFASGKTIPLILLPHLSTQSQFYLFLIFLLPKFCL